MRAGSRLARQHVANWKAARSQDLERPGAELRQARDDFLGARDALDGSERDSFAQAYLSTWKRRAGALPVIFECYEHSSLEWRLPGGSDDAVGSGACPFCESRRVHATQAGFNALNALAGSVLFGGAGLLAGFIGSGDTRLECLACGYRWRPGDPWHRA